MGFSFVVDNVFQVNTGLLAQILKKVILSLTQPDAELRRSQQ